MKYILFFAVIGIFIWIAVVPPEGMSKYPAVNVQFDSAAWSGNVRLDVSN